MPVMHDGAYRPSKAQQRTNGRRRRSRSVRHHEQSVYTRIEGLLEEDEWSPEQIAHWLALHGIARISHMTIYRYIREDARYGGRLWACLRQGGKRRRKRTFGPEKRGRLPEILPPTEARRKPWNPVPNPGTGKATR